MRGEYIFYAGGREVHSPNLITSAGQKLILQYLAGQANSIGESLAIGIGDVAESAGDSDLTHEVYRAKISLKTVDFTTKNIILKLTIPQEVVVNIKEIGVLSGGEVPERSSRLLSFIDLEEWILDSYASFVNSNVRWAGQGILITAPAGASSTIEAHPNLDLSGYTDSDKFSLALNKAGSVEKVTISLYDINGNISYKDITSFATGYQIIEFSKSSLTSDPSFDWSNISKMTILTKSLSGGSSSVTFDSLILKGVSSDSVLVSRSVLPVSIDKTSIAPMDIEYRLFDVEIS